MSSRIVTVTREELSARRADLLDRAGLTWEEFKGLPEAEALGGDDWETFEELREIAFLLGETPLD